MEMERLCAVSHEIFLLYFDLNPNFIKGVFSLSPHLTRRKENIYLNSQNTV